MSKDAVRIIPLGGLGEIGKNMTVVEYDGKIVVVDCGLAFPRDEMPGIDLVLPDVSYLIERKDDVLGFLITHGHEDHFGALPYILRQVNAPVYASRLTLAFAKSKLDEHGMLRLVEINEVDEHTQLEVGPFRVSFVAVSHSVPDALSVIIETPLGAVVATGDYKFDHTPDRRPRDRRQPLRAAGRTRRVGAARGLDQRRRARLDGVGEHRRAVLPSDLRRGPGAGDPGLLRLAHPPRAAGHPDRPSAWAPLRHLRALDGEERQHRAHARLPERARRRDDQAPRHRRLQTRGAAHPFHGKPGRAALGSLAHGLRRSSPGGLAAGRHGRHLGPADTRQRSERHEHRQPLAQVRSAR